MPANVTISTVPALTINFLDVEAEELGSWFGKAIKKQDNFAITAEDKSMVVVVNPAAVPVFFVESGIDPEASFSTNLSGMPAA